MKLDRVSLLMARHPPKSTNIGLQVYSYLTFMELVFTESALWADSVYKLICPSVCPCVRLSVCVCAHF